jgi:hypothetical protein
MVALLGLAFTRDGGVDALAPIESQVEKTKIIRFIIPLSARCAKGKWFIL